MATVTVALSALFDGMRRGRWACWAAAVLAWSEIRGLGMDLFVDPFDCSGGLGGIALVAGLEADSARCAGLVSGWQG